MKKLFALLMLWLMVAMTGCGNISVRMDAGMAVKPDGSVSVKSKMLSNPIAYVQGELLKAMREAFAPQAILPAAAGGLSGYEGVSNYKSITDLAKTDKLGRGLSDPGTNLHADGILYRSGILYDYCTLDMLSTVIDLPSAHTYNVPGSPGFYFTLDAPYEVETTNADIISKDKKQLVWDLSRGDLGGKHRSIKASFRIWHKGAVIGLAVLIVVLLGAGAVFYKKSKASYVVEEQKSKRNISFASLGAAALILVFMLFRVTSSPTSSGADRVSPLYNAAGQVVEAAPGTTGGASAPQAKTEKTDKDANAKTEKDAKNAGENKQDSNTNNANAGAKNADNAAAANVPIVIAGAYHSSADQEGSYVHSAKLAVDGNPSSCWSEGVKGLGIDENIEIHFNATCKVSGMNIWIGHQKSEALFYQNARPVALRVVGSDGSSEVYKLKDTFGSQRVEFKQPITVNKIKLVVQEVARGSKYEDTSIAEVNFF